MIHRVQNVCSINDEVQWNIGLLTIGILEYIIGMESIFTPIYWNSFSRNDLMIDGKLPLQ